MRTARLTNQRPFNQPTTEVQYREGYAAAAAALASKLQHPVQVKLKHDLASHIDVRLVLGKDVLSDVALLAAAGSGCHNNRCTIRLLRESLRSNDRIDQCPARQA